MSLLIKARRMSLLLFAYSLFASFAAHAQTIDVGVGDLTNGSATLRVVHGIPGRDVGPTLDPLLPVDVLVNGQVCLLKGLTFGQIAGPSTLPVGKYDVAVSLANTLAPCSNTPVIKASVSLAKNDNLAVVATLDTRGQPTAAPFKLNFTSVPAGRARFIFAQAANVLTTQFVSLTLSGPPVFSDIQPGQLKSTTLPAKEYPLTVFPAGATRIGPSNITLAPRSVTVTFLVGSASSDSTRLVTATIPSVF